MEGQRHSSILEPLTEIDWTFVKSIFNWQGLLFPMTYRRAATWAVYLSLAAAYTQLDLNFRASKAIQHALDENILAVSLLTYGLEPLVICLYMVLARYPYFEPTLSLANTKKTNAIPKKNHDCVLIIPCHLSASSELEAQSLRVVLKAALRHFPPEQILIIDNGREKTAPDNTQEVVKGVNERIYYKYYPYPNKTVATYVGTLLAKRFFGEKIKYALYIDDDVELPENFKIEHEFFINKKVRGIIYPILAKAASGVQSSLINLQNIEYQLSDLALAAHDATKSAQAAHGACVLLHVETALKVLARHTGMFKGEDKEIGERLRSLYDVQGRLKLRVDMNCHFKTNVPESYLGSNGNLYQQRVRSWSEAPFLYFLRLTLLPVLTDWRRKPEALLIIKFDQLYNLASQLSHIFRYLIIYLEARNPKFWVVFVGMLGVQVLTLLLFNYGKLPPYLRNELNDLLLFPFYKQVDNLLSHLAFWRVLLFTFPGEHRHQSIFELMKQGVLPPFELEEVDPEKGEMRVFEESLVLESLPKKKVGSSTGLMLNQLDSITKSPKGRRGLKSRPNSSPRDKSPPSLEESLVNFFSVKTIFPDSDEDCDHDVTRKLGDSPI